MPNVAQTLTHHCLFSLNRPVFPPIFQLGNSAMTFTETHTETKDNGIVIHNFRDSRGYEYHVVISEQHASIGQKMARSFAPGRGVYVWPLESWQAMDAAARRCIAAALEVSPSAVKLDPDVTAAAVHVRGPWWTRHYVISR